MKLIRTKGRGAQRRSDHSPRSNTAAARRSTPSARRRAHRGRRAQKRRPRTASAMPPNSTASPDAAALRVTPEEMAAAWDALDPALRDALTTAAAQIRAFAQCQLPDIVERLTHRRPHHRPARSPARRRSAATSPAAVIRCPSTLLMTAIPAQVAGVARIAVVSPKPAPETLAAAHLLGITEFYRLGGAHAIAALAYGTATLPRVDKIVGPGNLYVTAAKRLVAFDCAIDMLAGPTEIVVTSERGERRDIASDLVAQAEHDPEALAIFITTRADLAKEVIAETKLRSRDNPVARESLSRNGLVIVAASIGRSPRASPIASRPST